MQSIVTDFETFYSPDYQLKKLTTEAYVRDPRFEVILCGFKIGRDRAFWVDGPNVRAALRELELEKHAVIAQHSHFEGLILSHHYGIKPAYHIDTLSMARAVLGAKAGLSLAKLAIRFGIGVKGNEVVNAFGKRRADFSREDLRNYGRYCMNDCNLEFELAHLLGEHFQRSELDLIDSTVRLFTEPILQFRSDKLEKYVQHLDAQRADLLMQAGVQLCDITSNPKFAEALRFLGIDPPMKISNTTGLPTYAFAKTDPDMQELAEHEDDAVQALIAARINAKSTINQTRALRMIDMQRRGAACMYVNYYAAHTGRGGGGDKMNVQNLQRVAYNKERKMVKGFLRDAIEAPDGFEIVVGDSSNIESRTLDWLSGQEDMVEAYRLYDRGEGPDIYCVMAEKIFGRVITKEDDPKERFQGKTSKLGLGYGMGAPKFSITAKISIDEAERIKQIYRKTHSRVEGFWKRCDEALGLIAKGVVGAKVDYRGIITTCAGGLQLPNGLVIKYTDLRRDVEVVTKKGKHITYEGWSYFDGRARQKIYGGKVAENITQALARIIVLTQTLMVPRRLVLSVHDEGVWCVPISDVWQTVFEVEWALRQPLDWCETLPLNCEVGVNKSYGRAKT